MLSVKGKDSCEIRFLFVLEGIRAALAGVADSRVCAMAFTMVVLMSKSSGEDCC